MKEIMKRAWEIYRTLVGTRLEKLSIALKASWKEVKDMGKKAIKETRLEIFLDCVSQGKDIKSGKEDLSLECVITGKTFEIKEELKKLGARWNNISWIIGIKSNDTHNVAMETNSIKTALSTIDGVCDVKISKAPTIAAMKTYFER